MTTHKAGRIHPTVVATAPRVAALGLPTILSTKPGDPSVSVGDVVSYSTGEAVTIVREASRREYLNFARKLGLRPVHALPGHRHYEVTSD
jgi:hypothetical protein